MASPGLSGSFDYGPGAGETSVAEYLETIEILQEEIARLEHELLARDENHLDSVSIVDSAHDDHVDAADDPVSALGDPEELEQLKKELESRDETIVLLLDELSRVEEAQKAGRAEWEQLSGWVAELEHRVEGQDGKDPSEIENELVAQRHRLEALQLRSEQDRRTWEAQRQVYQEEIVRLQESLDQVSASSSATGDTESSEVEERVDPAAVEALQAENLRLRAAWQDLMERTSAAESSEALDAKLAESLDQQHHLRRKLEQAEDERKRERLEHEAAVAELRSQLAETSTPPPQEEEAKSQPAEPPAERDLDLRVRALRQHLQEIEQRERMEREERRQKNLVVRLSRLWSRTGPR